MYIYIIFALYLKHDLCKLDLSVTFHVIVI